MPFTDRQISALKPKTSRYEKMEPGRTGLGIRVTPNGSKTWAYRYRFGGEQRRMVFGSYPNMPLSKAHKALADAKDKLRAGIDPGAEISKTREAERNAETVGMVVEQFILLHVKRPTEKKPNGLRTAAEIERIFNIYVLPTWTERPFKEIRRSDVTLLLDEIENGRGGVMADRTLAMLSKMFNWYAIRHDDYISPIVRGMARTKPKDRARKRILSDDEIRLLWAVWSEAGTFGAMMQIGLLTGQRRAKFSAVRWQDIDLETGLWTLLTEPGEKNNPGYLTLPAMALEIIRAQPVVKGNPHVFAGRGRAAVNGFSKLKRGLDEKSTKANGGEPLPNWTVHDLRRTAKSLMVRAGVPLDISERVLGHVIGGVAGIYDRHPYLKEKADAMVKLAALVERIINQSSDNVIANAG